MKCFHGMTEKAFKQWIEGKCITNVISPWMCSEHDDMTYLHTIENSLSECDNDQDSAYCHAVQQAKESAIIQAAINSDSRVYVIEMDLPDDMLMVDNSCENMDFCRCIDSDVFDSYRNKAKIGMHSINPYFHVFRIAGLIRNVQFNKYRLDSELVEAAEIISKADYSAIHEFLYDIE